MKAQPRIFPTHESTKSKEELQEGFEVLDPRFARLIPMNPRLVHHWRGTEWSEGVVFHTQLNVVIWSDIPNNRMLQFDPVTQETTIFREPSNFTNGNTMDLEGRLVSAQHLTHCIARTERVGTVTTLVDRYRGKRLNSPNDLVVKSDGTIWFTDPPYGILSNREGERRDSEIGGCFVFRYDPGTDELEIVVDSLDRPNGLAFAPEEDLLYVSDTGALGKIIVFEVGSDGATLGEQREFAAVRPGVADGFRCDVAGNIWTSAEDGIQCYTSRGELIGKILIPEQRVANCCFGGREFTTLYIAGDTSLYSAELAIPGARVVQ